MGRPGGLTEVRNAAHISRVAAYTYDALDRLLIFDRGTSDWVCFRYIGLTAHVAEVVVHDAATVIRSVANAWSGERLLDWTGSGSNLRYYGTNAHHDVSWTATSTGIVDATLRYDPWGNLTSSSGTSLPDHRFQGSWYDTTTSLSWVVARWYAPSLARFVSEDKLLGAQVDPASRHLYAYAAGNAVNRWDPFGTCSPYRPWELDCTVNDFDRWTAYQRRVWMRYFQSAYAPTWFNGVVGVLDGAGDVGAIRPATNWFSRVDAFILAAIQDGQRRFQGKPYMTMMPAGSYWYTFFSYLQLRRLGVTVSDGTLKYWWGKAEQAATDYGQWHAYRPVTLRQWEVKSTTDVWRFAVRWGDAVQEALHVGCADAWWMCPVTWTYDWAWNQLESPFGYLLIDPRANPAIVEGLFEGLWSFWGYANFTVCAVVTSPLYFDYTKKLCNVVAQ